MLDIVDHAYKSDQNNLKRTEISVDFKRFNGGRPVYASMTVGYPSPSVLMHAIDDRKSYHKHIDLLSQMMSDSLDRSDSCMTWVDRDKAVFQGSAAVEFLISGVKYVETEQEAFAVLSAMLQEGLFNVTDDVPKVVPSVPVATAETARSNAVRPPKPPNMVHDKIFKLNSYFKCMDYNWKEYGRTEVVRGPSYSVAMKSIFIQFEGDITVPTYADGIIVDIKVYEFLSVQKSVVAMERDRRKRYMPSSPVSPTMSKRSSLIFQGRTALSNLLREPRASVFPRNVLATSSSPSAAVGILAKAPLGDSGVNVDTSCSSILDLSDNERQLKLYETYKKPPISSLNVPSQLLKIYSSRIKELLNIYANEAGQFALLQQRELLNNYMAFKTQLIPSMGGQTSFIPKTKRFQADVSRQFEITNLHRYNVSIVERENDIKGTSQVKNFDYEIITCGMPAAHSVGFKNGGLVTLQQEYLRLRRKAIDGYITKKEESRLERLGLQIDVRKDICLSQAISTLVTAFISVCRSHNVSSSEVNSENMKEYTERQFMWWTQLYKVGFLAHFECLLGENYETSSDAANQDSEVENAIFEDAFVALRSLDRVVFKICKEPLTSNNANAGDASMEEMYSEDDGTCVRVSRLKLLPHSLDGDEDNDPRDGSGGVGKILIEVHFGSKTQFAYETLPEAILEGQPISTRTVITSQNLNVTALENEAIKAANDEGYEKLLYYHSLRKRLMGPNAETNGELDELFVALESCSKKLVGLKDVSDIYTWLLVSERITRLFEGARITCCKDGAGLSIMGSTLEMSVLVRDNHALNAVETLANVMRMSGVNLVNLQKSTFQQFYELQRENLPRLYRPPSHMTRSNSESILES